MTGPRAFYLLKTACGCERWLMAWENPLPEVLLPLYPRVMADDWKYRRVLAIEDVQDNGVATRKFLFNRTMQATDQYGQRLFEYHIYDEVLP